MLGLSYDWDREVDTTDPAYYRWTQWIFLQIYNSWFDPRSASARPIADARAGARDRDAAGLPGAEPVFRRRVEGHERDERATRCPGPVPPGLCGGDSGELVRSARHRARQRRGGRVDRKRVHGRAPADATVDDAHHRVCRTAAGGRAGRSTGPPRHWSSSGTGSAARRGRRSISRSPAGQGDIRVFTTRPDTIFGATYMVLAPEHPLVDRRRPPPRPSRRRGTTTRRRHATRRDLERGIEAEKTGVFTGGYRRESRHRCKQIPVWIADYVLMGYGTGAIMAVPGTR